MNDFFGYPVQHFSSKFLEVDCLSTAGPRIVRLSYKGSENLLAEVPDVALSTPYGDYHYLGGHRLWHAPESMPRSYIPDGEGLVVSNLPDGLSLNGPVEPGTGIRKRLEVHVDPDQARVTLTHTLTNEGLWEVQLAPWAITMLRLGGTAILPCRVEAAHWEGLLPDRQFSLWPYSHIDDPRLKLADDFVAVHPRDDMPAFKIGTFNPRGWTAYWLEGVLFRKSFAVQAGPRYPDHDCNAEIYCESHFIELETLGPLRRLGPGEFVTLDETWEFYDSLDQSFLSHKMMELLSADVG